MTHQPRRCCNGSRGFGLSATYAACFSNGPLKVAGVDREGEARVVELPGHPFFVATLFLPQLISRPDAPHPLVLAYLRAAISFRNQAGEGR
jgi:CTP synthase (UTP-ammonia lyase)